MSDKIVGKQRKPRQTKSAWIARIENGDLYFEEARQCSLEHPDFAEFIECEKVIRVVSLASSYYSREYLSGVGFVNFNVNVEMTLRMEIRNASKSRFWYAYRRVGGRLLKRFVGDDESITAKRILEVAQHMV